jgi:hypothetical protein
VGLYSDQEKEHHPEQEIVMYELVSKRTAAKVSAPFRIHGPTAVTAIGDLVSAEVVNIEVADDAVGTAFRDLYDADGQVQLTATIQSRQLNGHGIFRLNKAASVAAVGLGLEGRGIEIL